MAHAAMIADARQEIDAHTEFWAKKLLNQGYIIIPNAVDATLVNALEQDLLGRFNKTPFCDGAFYGNRTKRFHRLLTHSQHSAQFVQHELILSIVQHVLKPWCDCFQLNLAQAIEVHPGSRAQVPHRDQDMWGGQKGETEYLVNVMWPFSRYTRDNGATIIWPDSHKKQEELLLPAEDSINAEMEPGSVLLFLGSTLHSGGQNSRKTIRRGMIVSYCLGWLKPYENQWLSYPPEIARHFDPELAALVGYRQHRPNLGNFDGQCPSVLLRDDAPEYFHAVDDLRPDQEQMVEDYYAGRLQIAA